MIQAVKGYWLNPQNRIIKTTKKNGYSLFDVPQSNLI